MFRPKPLALPVTNHTLSINTSLCCLGNRSFELCPQLGGCRPFPCSESSIKRILILVAEQVRHLCDIDIRPVEILARQFLARLSRASSWRASRSNLRKVDLKSNSLIGPVYQGDAFVWHVVLPYVARLAAPAILSSSAIVSAGTSNVAAARFSRRWPIDDVPGMRSMFGAR